MFKQSEFRIYFYIALALHMFVLAMMIMSFEFSSKNFVLENSNSNEVINAIIMDESKLQMANPTPIAPPKVQKEPKKVVKRVIPKPIEKKPEPVKAKPLPEPKATKPQEKTIAIQDKRKKELEKELLEQQLLADLKKQVTKQKKIKQNDIEKAFEKELKEHAAKSLQQQLLNEKGRLASTQAKKMSGIVDKYKALILQAIGQHWLVPNGVDKSLTSQLLIRVAPGGVVLDVQLVKSSGDDSLDRSARVAIFKASPLPVPTASDEFEPFRQFILKVKPENVVGA